MIDSRSLMELHPVVRTRFALVSNEYKQVTGNTLLVTSTYRDDEMQAFLYAQGRTRPGKIITNANVGQSAHQLRIAVDAYPMIGGKILWEVDANKDGAIDTDWLEYGRIAKKHGFSWSGDWKGSLRELPHVQFTGGYTLSAIIANPRLVDNFK